MDISCYIQCIAITVQNNWWTVHLTQTVNAITAKDCVKQDVSEWIWITLFPVNNAIPLNSYVVFGSPVTRLKFKLYNNYSLVFFYQNKASWYPPQQLYKHYKTDFDHFSQKKCIIWCSGQIWPNQDSSLTLDTPPPPPSSTVTIIVGNMHLRPVLRSRIFA